jgi:hypothetical protein
MAGFKSCLRYNKKHRQKGGAFLFQRMKNVAELVTHGVIQVLPPLQRKKHRQKAVLFLLQATKRRRACHARRDSSPASATIRSSVKKAVLFYFSE